MEIVFLFNNNVPKYVLALITQTAPGNGSASVVLLSVALSTKGLSINAQNRIAVRSIWHNLYH